MYSQQSKFKPYWKRAAPQFPDLTKTTLYQTVYKIIDEIFSKARHAKAGLQQN